MNFKQNQLLLQDDDNSKHIYIYAILFLKISLFPTT
jgi:hypothetical protein